MKLLLPLIIAFGMCINAFSQIINGNFENWNTISWETLDFANTLTEDLIANGSPSNTIKTSDSQNGNFALRLESVLVDDVEPVFGFALFGQFGDDGAETGYPFSQNPSTIQGYYKCNLAPGDTAILLVSFWSNDETISLDLFKFAGEINAYTNFSFPLNIPFGANIDSVTVGMASANAVAEDFSVTPGSWIQFDNFSFGGFGITENLPNADFENWTTVSVDEPANWFTFNAQLQAFLGNSYVERHVPGYAGNSAVKITTISFSDGQIGFISNGSQGLQGEFGGGVPFTNLVDTLCGYYIYQPAAGSNDSAIVNLVFSAAGDEFAYAPRLFESAAQYTYFEIPFFLFQAPEQVRIDISSSKFEQNLAYNGSTLIIDELQFKSAPLSTNIKKPFHNPFSVMIFPNPAKDFVNLTFETTEKSIVFLLYDNLGNVMLKESKNTMIAGKHTIQINIANFASGIYHYQIAGQNSILKSGKLVKN